MTRSPRLRLIATFALSVAGGGCRLETDHITSTPFDATGADAGGDAADEQTDEREVPPPESCRWQGYGIGPPGHGQCEMTHLAAHAVVECTGVGGEFFEGRNIAGACATGAEEVQVYCCFAGDVPSLEATSGITAFDRHLQPATPSATRDDVLASAVLVCEAEARRLGDWSLIYGPDSSVARLRFQCQ